MWFLTRGAVAIDSTDPIESVDQLLQGLTWGFGRVVGLECPDRWGGLIDLPAEIDERTAGHLLATLTADDFEDQVALRRAGRLVRRLVRVKHEIREPAWEPRGSVLITGVPVHWAHIWPGGWLTGARNI